MPFDQSLVFGADPSSADSIWSAPLSFDRIANFRDLALADTIANTGVSQPRLRRNIVFRSDSLAYASPKDIELLSALDIRTVIDLRRDDEAIEAGLAPDAIGADRFNLPAMAGEWSMPSADQLADAERFLADRYLDMAHHGARAFADSLQLLVERPGASVFHCMAGKDRTGVLAALLLMLLDVDDHTIATDYAYTATNMAKLMALVETFDPLRFDGLKRIPEAFLGSPYGTMRQFLLRFRDSFGGPHQYFAREHVSDGTMNAWRTIMLLS